MGYHFLLAVQAGQGSDSLRPRRERAGAGVNNNQNTGRPPRVGRLRRDSQPGDPRV